MQRISMKINGRVKEMMMRLLMKLSIAVMTEKIYKNLRQIIMFKKNLQVAMKLLKMIIIK
ncbi:MAG: hypothetical protein AABW80_03970 [Nanoarchaeota archaeon]